MSVCFQLDRLLVVQVDVHTPFMTRGHVLPRSPNKGASGVQARFSVFFVWKKKHHYQTNSNSFHPSPRISELNPEPKPTSVPRL